MKKKYIIFTVLLMLIQVVMPIDVSNRQGGVISYAEGTDIYIQANDLYYRIKDDFSGYGRISRESYEEQMKPVEEQVVAGIDAVKIPYEQVGQDIFARGVKVFTLEKDPVDAGVAVHYSVSSLYEIKTKDNRLFYYIINDDGIANPNSYGDTDDLVEVKDGKVIHHIKVYFGLEYVTSDVWRSTAAYSGAGYYELTQHSISGKFKDIKISSAVSNYALKTGKTYKLETYDVEKIGTMNDNIIFGVHCRDKRGTELPMIRIYEVSSSGDIWERREYSKSLTDNLFIHNFKIYSLDQDGQVLRRLKDLRSIYLEAGSTQMGKLSKTGKTVFKAKLPLYTYQKGEYICLEDLRLMGFTMKWDGKAKVGHWTYTGKKTGKPHDFKNKVIYDNDVFATIKGEYVHIYNAEGYSLLSLLDAQRLVQD